VEKKVPELQPGKRGNKITPGSRINPGGGGCVSRRKKPTKRIGGKRCEGTKKIVTGDKGRTKKAVTRGESVFGKGKMFYIIRGLGRGSFAVPKGAKRCRCTGGKKKMGVSKVFIVARRTGRGIGIWSKE